ncbi:uncharacterized protein J3D65DRAFT_635744 [Phyllosticta citribraziliensis]|uniref:Uncharacterized protein n=1 Tax=Phyllosticta citribraziliensis TaxID=989973 RepID=A0ABR1LA17_9PEZI
MDPSRPPDRPGDPNSSASRQNTPQQPPRQAVGGAPVARLGFRAQADLAAARAAREAVIEAAHQWAEARGIPTQRVPAYAFIDPQAEAQRQAAIRENDRQVKLYAARNRQSAEADRAARLAAATAAREAQANALYQDAAARGIELHRVSAVPLADPQAEAERLALLEENMRRVREGLGVNRTQSSSSNHGRASFIPPPFEPLRPATVTPPQAAPEPRPSAAVTRGRQTPSAVRGPSRDEAHAEHNGLPARPQSSSKDVKTVPATSSSGGAESLTSPHAPRESESDMIGREFPIADTGLLKSKWSR